MEQYPSYSTHLAPGTMLANRYRIIQELGSGSFGVTYYAADTVLQIYVAIKEYFPTEHVTREAGRNTVTVFSGGHASLFAEGKNKFLQEARILAKFQNEPGIVRILNVLEENGTAYLVMEYLEGETLKSYLDRNGALGEDAAVYVLTPLMKSLRTVHAAEILHRDISPDNIFMTMDGRAKLIDFGTARYTAGSQSLTVVVRPGFSPEEQYRSLGDQGPYTDVYALAAVLYRMITGQNPPDAFARRAGIEKNRRDILPELHTLNRDVSQVRENAILNALNVDIRDRTPDIDTFLRELNADEPAPRRLGSIRKTNRFNMPLWMKIAVPAVLAAAVAMIILLATGVISFSRFSQNGKKPDGAVTVPEVEGMEKEKAVERIEKETLRAGTNGAAVSDYVPAGKIVLQTPSGGTYLFPGDEVLLTVSRGEGVVKPKDGVATMPYVTWAAREEAVEFLEEAGFGVPEIVEEYSDIVQEGSVISQSIEYGEKVEEGTTVTLVVSLGEETGEIQNHHIDVNGSGSGSGAEDGASEASAGAEAASGDGWQYEGIVNEGVRILSVVPDRTPQSEDEKLRVFVSVEYDLVSSDEGWLMFYVKQGEEYVNKAGMRVKKGHGEENIDFGDVKAGELMNYPVLAVLEDGERGRLAEDEFDFNLLTYLDPTLVPGNGMDYVDMQISGRTLTVSLIYDKMKESFTVDGPGLTMYSSDVLFCVRFYDGFRSYVLATSHSVESETARSMSVYDMNRHLSRSRAEDEGGGFAVYPGLTPEFSVNGTKMTWTVELPEEVHTEYMMITGWQVVTHEEDMYFYGDVADGIHRVPHTEREETGAVPETDEEPGTLEVVKAQGPPDGDYIRIVSVEPGYVATGKEALYTVTLEYSIESSEQGEIYIGMNTEKESGFIFYNGAIVERGSGTLKLRAEMEASVQWRTSIHAILSEYPHPDQWNPITGDVRWYDMNGDPE